MSDKSNIQWTDATWSPITGCARVSPGCDNCYAETMSRRLAAMGQSKYQGVADGDGWTRKVRLDHGSLHVPLEWKKPRRVFVCSMSDLFHSAVPWQYICEVFDVMARCPQHTFQVLTKRPGRMRYFADRVWEPYTMERNLSSHIWPSNIWAGTSVESAKYLPRLDLLAGIPARVRFVSCEPLLGPLDLRPWLDSLLCTCGNSDVGCEWDCGEQMISWVIVGGESGPNARPMHPDWVRDIREQCLDARVPFFLKQLGEYREFVEGDLVITRRGYPRFRHPAVQVDGIPRSAGPSGATIIQRTTMLRVGRKAAGATLDGREWREFPDG